MAKKISEQGEVDIETQLQEIFRMFDRKGFLFNLFLLITYCMGFLLIIKNHYFFALFFAYMGAFDLELASAKLFIKYIRHLWDAIISHE